MSEESYLWIVVEFLFLQWSICPRFRGVRKLNCLPCSYLCKPFDCYSLVQCAKVFELELDLDVYQSTKDHRCFLGLHNLKSFTISPTICLLMYTLIPALRNEMASWSSFRVASSPRLAYFKEVLFHDTDCNAQRVQRTVELKLFISALDALLQIFHDGVTARYYNGRIQQACEGRCTLVPHNQHI